MVLLYWIRILTSESVFMHFLATIRFSLFALVVGALSVHTVQSGSSADDTFKQYVAPLLKKYCFDCHSGSGAEADVDFEALDAKNLAEHTELLSDMINAVDLGEMPPADADQPDKATRDILLKSLKSVLNQVVEESVAPPTPIRRMNRFQYNNAVVDLFQLKCIVFTLPERMMRTHRNYFKPETGKMPDVVFVGSRPLGKSQMIEPRLAGVAAFPQDLRAEHGFDNQADHLSLSPLLMESFLNLGQSITSSPDFNKKNVAIWNEFFAKPDESDDLQVVVRERLSGFLRRAFRQSVESSVVDRYAGYVHSQLGADVPFEQAMKQVAAAVISSPKFLYLYEERPGSGTMPVTDLELASRLSFFLWNSIPDATLLDLAERGELSQPKTLSAQVDRMLNDRKMKRFCDSFPAQWLQLERIISSTPDRKKFPQFYFSKYRDSMHMMMEPLLIFETVLIENLPVTQFIDSDFTYRSALLEDAYGALASKGRAKKKGGGVTQLKFERVPVTDRRNGGLITNAAIMTMTSGTHRTKPITRGAWMATVIFNSPPNPPPADVPPLEESGEGADDHLTLREKIKLHRTRSDCRGCHEKIDPLGFALENYDAIGRWRDQYENKRDVDMSGVLLGKHEFSSIDAFKDGLLVEKDKFVRGFAKHLLAFGLARRIDATDEPALDTVVRNSASDDYRLRAMLKHIVSSKPFLSKSSGRSQAASEDNPANASSKVP